jgi:hypothetical protein
VRLASESKFLARKNKSSDGGKTTRAAVLRLIPVSYTQVNAGHFRQEKFFGVRAVLPTSLQASLDRMKPSKCALSLRKLDI